MPIQPARSFVARTLTACLAVCALWSGSAFAQIEKPAIKFSMGWLFQATQAQFPLAYEKGYWKAEGMDVTVDRGAGSATSVQRVVSGAYDFAYADVGTVIKWNLENPGRELTVVYVAEDGFPLAAIALKKTGIAKPKDLEGKRLGAPPFDGGRQMFPVFAKANGIDPSKVTWMSMDANLREQMLAKGDVDVITGFITSAVPSLNSLGIKTSDLTVLRYDDYRMDGFGQAVIATRDFAEKHPKTVSAFVKGVNLAMKEMLANPKSAIDALKGRDPLINAEVETQRLALQIREVLLTKNVRENGFSAVDTKKLEHQIAAVVDAFGAKSGISVAGVYTDKFLPSKAERMPPAYKD